MSRHSIPNHKYPEVVVGWDAPLSTFFLHAYDSNGDIVVWHGTSFREVENLKDLETIATEHDIAIPADTLSELTRDQQQSPDFQQGPKIQALVDMFH